MSSADPSAASMVDGVYDSLLSAILETRLGAGTALSQNKLAAHLGVSRTPVREALLRLEREGLVQRLPEMGFVVASITPEEVHEACDLLVVLDTFVYLRAAKTLDSDDLHDLLALAEELVDLADSGDTDGWREADSRYHRVVMDAAANRFVAESLQQLRRRVQRFWLQKPDPGGRLRTCSDDHVALAMAMVRQDEVLLSATVHAHIERLRRSVLERLESAAALIPGTNPLSGLG